jgi:serine protease Do
MKVVTDDGEEESRNESDLSLSQLVEEIYGLQIATEGLIDRNDVTVSYVRSQSLAAQAELAAEPPTPKTSDEILDGLLARGAAKEPPEAPSGLQMGDVLVAIDNEPTSGPQQAVERLVDAWTRAKRLKSEGKEDEVEPIALTIRRGLPHPYASHPRLDLYVGSLSPHKKSEFACTVCHEGQGSATEFKWASHTPSSEAERKGLQMGDLILEADKQKMESVKDLEKIIDKKKPGQVVLLSVRREGRRATQDFIVTLRIPE